MKTVPKKFIQTKEKTNFPKFNKKFYKNKKLFKIKFIFLNFVVKLFIKA